MILKNKKGAMSWMTEHLGKFVMAIIVLLILFGFAAKLYSVGKQGDLRMAEKILDNFLVEYNYFIESEEQSKEFVLLGPKDWYLIFYQSGIKPAECNWEWCACMCKENNINECDRVGVCGELKKEWFWEEDYELNTIPYGLNITKK